MKYCAVHAYVVKKKGTIKTKSEGTPSKLNNWPKWKRKSTNESANM